MGVLPFLVIVPWLFSAVLKYKPLSDFQLLLPLHIKSKATSSCFVPKHGFHFTLP